VNANDHTLLVVGTVLAGCWMFGLGVWWERNRAGGTRHQRALRDEARKQRDELTDVVDALTRTSTPQLPRPAAGRRTQPQPAAERHLKAVTRDGADVLQLRNVP
jgi:hypothetical protein